MDVLLCAWGIGGFLEGKNRQGKINHGIFKEEKFLTSSKIEDRIYNDPLEIPIPPLSRLSPNGIDYTPCSVRQIYVHF